MKAATKVHETKFTFFFFNIICEDFRIKAEVLYQSPPLSVKLVLQEDLTMALLLLIIIKNNIKK